MGVDDEKLVKLQNKDVRKEIREKHNIQQEDFLIITGGKVDNAKTNFISYECSAKIENKNVKLIVFGSVIDDLREEISKLADGVKVQYIGWINSEESYKYFGASDLVVFPGRHSVFWEEVAGLGIPMIVKYWSEQLI